MAYADWRIPLQAVRASCGPPTHEQRDLAQALHLVLADNEPTAVVAARLHDALAGPLGLAPAELRSTAQQEFLEVLRDRVVLPELDALSWRVASAWIEHFLAVRTAAALERFEPCRGDLITVRIPALRTEKILPSWKPLTRVVSSISDSGRLNLTRERGVDARASVPGESRRARSTAWPDWIESIVHAGLRTGARRAAHR